jgi:hypothetical protein
MRTIESAQSPIKSLIYIIYMFCDTMGYYSVHFLRVFGPLKGPIACKTSIFPGFSQFCLSGHPWEDSLQLRYLIYMLCDTLWYLPLDSWGFCVHLLIQNWRKLPKIPIFGHCCHWNTPLISIVFESVYTRYSYIIKCWSTFYNKFIASF